MFRYKALFTLAFFVAAAMSASAMAEDYVITLKDHQFTPQTLVLPAKQKIKLTIKNEQTSPAEFESSDLSREKVVGPGSQIIVNLGPLDAGDYKYFDDFHRDSTGIITVK